MDVPYLQRGVFVGDLTEEVVMCPEQVYELMKQGEGKDELVVSENPQICDGFLLFHESVHNIQFVTIQSAVTSGLPV